MNKRTNTLFIVTNPIGSKFARAIQEGLREATTARVFRVGRSREGRKNFVMSPRGMDKIEQLTRFKDNNVSCPPFVTDSSQLASLESKTIFARRLINSTNGRGIVEFDFGDDGDIPAAPLHVGYIPKKAEYRFHVFEGQVIDVQEKRKKRGFDGDRDTRIRNVNNGYVYCRDGIATPDGAADLAVRAVQALGYQYGAVDVIYNEKRNQSYVLEVNSRPGLMGTTLQKYVGALINLFNLEVK